jgi:hypothetical protein
MAHTNIPDAQAMIASRTTDVPWFLPDMGNKLETGSSMRKVLENYSKIPAAEVEDHVREIVRSISSLPSNLSLTRVLSFVAPESLANLSLSLHWRLSLPRSSYRQALPLPAHSLAAQGPK